MLKVGHVLKPETHEGSLIYIGRNTSYSRCPKGTFNCSVLGNPFVMKSEKERDEVCVAYRGFLKSFVQQEQGQKVLNKLRELHSRTEIYTLLCFCYPKRCHGNELIKFVS